MFCLPSPFTGGNLAVRHQGREVVFDWAEQVIDRGKNESAVAWGFLYNDVEHEVFPVTSGTRITLAYDIYAVENIELPTPVIAQPIRFALAKLLDPATGFYPDGGEIAIGFQHGYAMEEWKDFEKVARGLLKGHDATVVDAIESLSLRYKLVAVYNIDEDEYGYHEEEEEESGEESEEDGDWTRSQELISGSFWCADSGEQWNGSEKELVEAGGGEKRPNYIWLEKTTEYGTVNKWISYGNEVSVEMAELTRLGSVCYYIRRWCRCFCSPGHGHSQGFRCQTGSGWQRRFQET
jgi:hypothetical protein